MIKKWNVKNFKAEITSPVVAGLSPLAKDVLAARSVTDVESAHNFFNAELFHSPFLLKDMDKAVEIVKEVLENGGRITVYGDYDCDGITATVMLYSYLTALGGEVDWYIPSRGEGYGLNAAAIEKIAVGGTELIITVDNGISAFAEAELIKQKGIKLIITDHHTPYKNGECLPQADAIINPKQRDCSYPFKELAGCGVALKLICAMENSDGADVIEQYGDLAAIGTIADIVPITDENRQIVALGLQHLEYSENIGLHCLMKKAGLGESHIDSTALAFILCPRINAAGRLAHPGKAVELLLCENHEIASAKAEELNALNRQRVEEEREIISQIEKLLSENPRLLKQRVLVLSGKDWNPGIIGIIASRMVTRYGKPCVVITHEVASTTAKAEQEQRAAASPSAGCLTTAKASCRSVGGFSVYEMLAFCGDLLVNFGGHAGAGGFSLESEKIEALTERIHEYARTRFTVMPELEVGADSIPNAHDINVENVEKLEMVQPFGEGNTVPIFYLPNCLIKSKRPLKEGKYISFTAEYQGRDFKVLDFSRSYADFWYKIGDMVDLMLNFSINEYNDSKDVSMKIVDIRLSGLSQDRFFLAKATYEQVVRDEEIDGNLYSRIVPGDSDMKRAYDIIRNSGCLDEIVQRGVKSGINYCMLRVIIDVFEEMGLLTLNPVTGGIEMNKSGTKADLNKSEVLINLKLKAERSSG
ncbi:MAG: single-stranded-DNA-specific exonuclease RecJ [Oscillospiraceae bacterium]|nr:single-stranded-DNA-specific exonuclease RecJ [Oscillospiraceae bacterium]